MAKKKKNPIEREAGFSTKNLISKEVDLKATVSEHTEIPPHFWFKNKQYGYGWTPVSRQGWLVLFGFIVYTVVQVLDLTIKISSDIDYYKVITVYLFNFASAITCLLLITYLTGQKSKWSWGSKK
jgi:hypothetical protein